MSAEQEFKCVFCEEKFTDKEELQIHFRKHADPSFNPNKRKGRFEVSNDGCSDKRKEQAEVVECDVCPEVFSTISKAITHKHKMHPDHDTKYFCPWCGKLFTMMHLFKKHMNSTHLDTEEREKRIFHCDSCEVDFNGPSAVLYHNKFYHRQEEMPVLGHSKKLKMVLQEIVLLYYCPFCGEEYENKVNLHKHINDDHSSENNSPSDVFRCPLCDAIFYYLDAYELHLTHHCTEDLYTERNDMVNQITDFSLETVQPIQEKIESVESDTAAETMNIEDLLELSMNDDLDSRKPKKHKKHKKSKKSAITLDEFFNMNKDVFGEDIDVQGVVEVPTQAIKKRLKSNKAVVASQLKSADIAKLKKQGIVIKKQPTIVKPADGNIVQMKSSTNNKKIIIPVTQTKSNPLPSADAVLSKLMNQGSQIKIVKKSNQDSTDELKSQDKEDEEEVPEGGSNEEIGQNNVTSLADQIKKNAIESSKECASTDSPQATYSKTDLQEPLDRCHDNSPSSTNENTHNDVLSDKLDNSAEENDEVLHRPVPEIKSKLCSEVRALQNNSNITMKLPKKLAHIENEISNKDTKTNIRMEEYETSKSEHKVNNPEESNSQAPNSSLNALKNLSHLVTVKPVNISKAIPLPYAKLNPSPEKSEINTKETSPAPSPKSEAPHISNLKKLDGITIRPTNKSNNNESTNNHQAATPEEEDNAEPNHNPDAGWHDYSDEDNIDTNNITASELNVETKYSPKSSQKESPKSPLNVNQNSKSSVDLLKHLKNITAKPVSSNITKVSTSKSSPNVVPKNIASKTSVQKEICEDGTEIFSIDDSDSEEELKNTEPIKNLNKTESKIVNALKNVNKNISLRPTNQHKQKHEMIKTVSNKIKKENDECLNNPVTETTTKLNSHKANQNNVAINNVLRNLSKNITVKSRNSSPSQSARSQDSQDSHHDDNDTDSDSDTPLSRVRITEMDNADNEEIEQNDVAEKNVTVEHPDDSHSEHGSEPHDDYVDDTFDIEAQIAAAKLEKNESPTETTKSKMDNKSAEDDEGERATSPVDDIPSFAKNLGNQISIKQIKKPGSRIVNQQGPRSKPQNAVQSNETSQVNTFNKEVKTVKTFQTQTKTVVQEITTTVTKTIKTMNQTMKREVRSAQSGAVTTQTIKGYNQSPGPGPNVPAIKVRHCVPAVRPKIRGMSPLVRPVTSIQPLRPAICGPTASNQLVPVLPALNRPRGPRPRVPNVTRLAPPRPVRPPAARPARPAAPKPQEQPGHFSCFKKPKESLIPEPDFSNNEDSFSSTVQMSKSNFSSTSRVVQGNSVVTSTRTKSEMSANSQQLSKLRGVSGLVVKSSQNHAKQTLVEQKCEMSASKKNALEAIQKLQSQGLLVKKPRLDEDSELSQHGSDNDGEHCSDDQFDEDM